MSRRQVSLLCRNSVWEERRGINGGGGNGGMEWDRDWGRWREKDKVKMTEEEDCCTEKK